jgi:hypothetical protein
MRKTQTSTEYLILLAVVVVIAIVVVSVMGGIPGIGGGVSKGVAKNALANEMVAVLNYAITDYYTVIQVQNRLDVTVQLDAIEINSVACSSDLPNLKAGEKKKIYCNNVYGVAGTEANFPIVINYTDIKARTSYTQNKNELRLIGPVGEGYFSYLDNLDLYNPELEGCWDISGSEPFPICTCKDLEKINSNTSTLSYDYYMLNNIDIFRCDDSYMTGEGWVPIGATGGDQYLGTFNGSGFYVSNVRINRPSNNYQGLFGYTYLDSSNYAKIYDLGVINADINALGFSGALVGMGRDSVVVNSYAQGTIAGMDDYIGLLIGYGRGAKITNSYAIGSASGVDGVGVLVGWGRYTKINDSYSSGFADGGMSVGGLVGDGYDSTIHNSYSSANVNGDQSVGGLVGFGRYEFINASYASGVVTGNDEVGGIVGWTQNPDIYDCYFTGTVNATTGSAGGIVGRERGGGDIQGCYNLGDVYGSMAGGIVGYGYNTDFDNCYSNGTIRAESAAGGIVAFDLDGGSISNSWASGTIIVTDPFWTGGGGIAGSHNGGGSITNCDSINQLVYGYDGQELNGDAVGAIVGSFDGTMIDCTSTDSVVIGDSYVGGLVGAGSGSIDNSYTTGKTYCRDGSCVIGGLIGTDNTMTVTSSTWTNHPDDNATACTGSGGISGCSP